MIEFEEDGEMTVVWAGNYNDYEKTFKNNRNVIKKWLEITNGFKTKEKRFSERIEYLTAHHQIKQGICWSSQRLLPATWYLIKNQHCFLWSDIGVTEEPSPFIFHNGGRPGWNTWMQTNVENGYSVIVPGNFDTPSTSRVVEYIGNQLNIDIFNRSRFEMKLFYPHLKPLLYFLIILKYSVRMSGTDILRI